jgi:hypothetical protein
MNNQVNSSLLLSTSIHIDLVLIILTFIINQVCLVYSWFFAGSPIHPPLCAFNSPVHPRIEGNQRLPNGTPMAPRPLGAIKGTPRRMEQYTKHSKSTLQLWNFATTPSKCLREIWALFSVITLSLCCWLCSLHLCVCCCCVLLMCVYSTPSLTSVLIVITCVRRERLQLVEIPHNRDIVRYKEEPWYTSFISGSLERGWVQPSSIGMPQRGVCKHITLDRTMG